VLVLEANRLAAVVAEVWPDGVECAAVIAKHLGGTERIDLDLGSAVFTVSAASLLLASLPDYKWSIDSLLNKNQQS